MSSDMRPALCVCPAFACPLPSDELVRWDRLHIFFRIRENPRRLISDPVLAVAVMMRRRRAVASHVGSAATAFLLPQGRVAWPNAC